MVEMYVPKVGDKVRATLGENVLVGHIHYTAESATVQSWLIVPDGVEDVDPYLLSAADGWHFEHLVSVPTKPFAVVGHPTDPDYAPYIRDRIGNWHEFGSEGVSTPAGAETVAYWLGRGFTVLFDGVDE